MTTAVAETYLRVNGSERAVQTGDMSTEDWVMPEIESSGWNNGETTAEEFGAGSSAPAAVTTTPAIRPNVSAPVRRDNLKIRLSDRGIKLLQQWECVVLDVHGESVECEMHDLTDDSQPVEYAEIYLDEFNLFDRHLLAEGTVFYWSVGREESKTGTIRRYSELRVRRMPPLSKLRKREIAQEAEHLSELLKKQSGS